MTDITLTVESGTIAYTATDYSGTYDGQSHGISVSVNSPADTAITYSTDGTNYESTNPSFQDAGTYTVYYRITKDNYDTITGSKTVTISKKALKAVMSDSDKVYDGSAAADVTATVDTGIAGETLIISGLKGSFADKNVGSDKTVTVDSSSVNVQAGKTGTLAANYDITYPATVTASITQLTAQLSWGNSTFTYNTQP